MLSPDCMLSAMLHRPTAGLHNESQSIPSKSAFENVWAQLAHTAETLQFGLQSLQRSRLEHPNGMPSTRLLRTLPIFFYQEEALTSRLHIHQHCSKSCCREERVPRSALAVTQLFLVPSAVRTPGTIFGIWLPVLPAPGMWVQCSYLVTCTFHTRCSWKRKGNCHLKGLKLSSKWQSVESS